MEFLPVVLLYFFLQKFFSAYKMEINYDKQRMLKFAGKTYIFYKTLEIGGGVNEKIKLQELR